MGHDVGSFNTTEFDIFLISYDEPNAEENWADLLSKAPWAKRVHGVKGFDSAHKACANQSETERFITVDGDNVVYPEFFDVSVNITDRFKDCVLSWAGRNVINELVYGNGGLKLWTRDFVLNMHTHENADRKEETVDFCWDGRYVQLNNTYSETRPNASPFQAFRAGFREGCKMTLDRGAKIDPLRIADVVHRKNLNRLLIWANVGADVKNGLWAIYGTRLGIHHTNIDPSFDIASISDYDWFRSYFYGEVLPSFIPDPNSASQKCPGTGMKWNPEELRERCELLGNVIVMELGLPMAELNANASSFFKSVYEPPKRSLNPMITEIEADAK